MKAVAVGLVAAVLSIAQSPAVLTGYVLTPEWLPVSSGTVTVQSLGSERTADIDSNGRFRFEALASGSYDVVISAPRLMSQRLKVTMPSSGLVLPPIKLSPETYVRLKVLSPTGQALPWAHILRESFDVSGARLRGAAEHSGHRSEPDNSMIVGPLPRGITVLAVDTPLFARTRLPDVPVTGESPLIDAGEVTLEPGTVLKVKVVDGAGEPVAGHAVHLDDGRAFSALQFMPVRTDANGYATFERLASGRYYLSAAGARRCGGIWPMVVRAVDVGRGQTVEKEFVIGGTLRLRVISGGVPFAGRTVSVATDAPRAAEPRWLRQPAHPAWRLRQLASPAGSPCTGVTDGDGRVTLDNVPPGPARASMRLPNSTWARRLNVGVNARELTVQIPAGVLPLRALSADAGTPVEGAAVELSSAGVRIEAATSVTGEALLDGVADGPGVATVRAPSYVPASFKFASPPGVLHEMRLRRAGAPELRCRIVDETGEPLAGAVIELAPHNRLDVTHVATTDAEGIVRFLNLAPGTARLVARADGYAAAIVDSIPMTPQAGGTTVTLSKGYRISVTIEPPVEKGAHGVHVMNDTGVAFDEKLDGRSERIVAGGGRLSLGPLSRGTYVVELRGPQPRRAQVRIEDADVALILR